MVGFGATAFMRVAGRVTGMDLLEDLADFFRNFEGMYDGFKQRAEGVLALLRAPTSQFVVVTSPQPPPLREARFFLERLEQEGLHCAGVVVNRVHVDIPGLPRGADLDKAIGSLADGGDDPADGAVAVALRLAQDVRDLAERERRDVNAALFGVVPPAVVEVPLLHTDVHDLDALATIANRLAGRQDR